MTPDKEREKKNIVGWLPDQNKKKWLGSRAIIGETRSVDRNCLKVARHVPCTAFICDLTQHEPPWNIPTSFNGNHSTQATSLSPFPTFFSSAHRLPPHCRDFHLELLTTQVSPVNKRSQTAAEEKPSGGSKLRGR